MPDDQGTPRTRIINRGRGHSYELDGVKVPGVTTVIDKGVPKNLTDWAARTVAEYVIERLAVAGDTITADELIADLRAFNDTRNRPEKLTGKLPRIGLANVLKSVTYADRDTAANRGTEVHKLAEQLARGDEVEVPDELIGHVDAYLRFLEEWRPTNALLERVVVSRRWGYMGKLDLIADFEQYGRGLLDIKTSRNVYVEGALQLAGYRFADTMLEGELEVPMPAVDWAGIIWVRADGYDVLPYKADADAFHAFLHAKGVGDWVTAAMADDSDVKGAALPAPSAVAA